MTHGDQKEVREERFKMVSTAVSFIVGIWRELNMICQLEVDGKMEIG